MFCSRSTRPARNIMRILLRFPSENYIQKSWSRQCRTNQGHVIRNSRGFQESKFAERFRGWEKQLRKYVYFCRNLSKNKLCNSSDQISWSTLFETESFIGNVLFEDYSRTKITWRQVYFRNKGTLTRSREIQAHADFWTNPLQEWEYAVRIINSELHSQYSMTRPLRHNQDWTVQENFDKWLDQQARITIDRDIQYFVSTGSFQRMIWLDLLLCFRSFLDNS